MAGVRLLKLYEGVQAVLELRLTQITDSEKTTQEALGGHCALFVICLS